MQRRVTAGRLGAVISVVAILAGGQTVPALAVADGHGFSVEEARQIARSVVNSEDPNAALAALSAQDRVAFDAVTKLVSQTEVVEDVPLQEALEGQSPAVRARVSAAVAAYTGCWSKRVGGKGASLVETLYTFRQDTAVCATNNQVYRVEVLDPFLEIDGIGWSEQKVPRVAKLNLKYEGRGLAQFYPILGWGGSSLQAPTVCAQARLNGNGVDHILKAADSASCDINGPW